MANEFLIGLLKVVMVSESNWKWYNSIVISELWTHSRMTPVCELESTKNKFGIDCGFTTHLTQIDCFIDILSSQSLDLELNKLNLRHQK